MFKISAKIYLLLSLVVFGQLVSAHFAVAAADLVVEPAVIDEQGMIKDIFEKKITLINQGKNKLFIYAVVSDISPENGLQAPAEPQKLDPNKSVARWIDFSRGLLEVEVGKKLTMPLRIRVGQETPVGKYHAQIAFVQAPNRAAAEGGMATAPKTLINIEIGERIVEKLESNLFKTKKNINTSGMVTFEYGISNLGNRDILPTGKIAIFNRSGAEVAELPVNGLAESIKVGEAKQYSINWNTGNMIGKYRARLQVEYGGEAKEHFQDTIYFWVLPMWLLIAIGGVGLFLLFIVFYLFMKMLRQDTVAIHYDYEVEERSHIIDLKNKKHDDDD